MFLLEHENISVGEGSVLSLIAILIVFVILVVIIFFVWLLSNIKFKEETPAKSVSNVKKLTIDDIKDEDMMVAALVATADFVDETKQKDARLVSIKKIG